MERSEFIQQMPKVELHVHLEGSVRPETLLKLAQRHGVALPADTVEGIREWYTFVDFDHFVEVYLLISECIRTAEDLELITREFLAGQAAQNIRYSEVTYTPYTHYTQKGISIEEQLTAINRARAWAEAELGVSMNLVLDIARLVTPEEGMVTAEWVIEHANNGVVALGLGGAEVGNPPEKFTAAFELVRAAGIPSVPHAGETEGPASIWGALRTLDAVRIGHGVRCVEDPALVDYLREHQIPLEVCPSSNVCLNVAPSFAEHPLPRLLAEGLYVTLNSDDPPMFNTTLTDEYLLAADAFDLDSDTLQRLVLNAVNATLLPEARQNALRTEVQTAFDTLEEQ